MNPKYTDDKKIMNNVLTKGYENKRFSDEKILEIIVEELIKNETDIGTDTESSSKANQGNTPFQQITGAVIGQLTDFNKSGQPLVDYPQNPNKGPISARTTINLSIDDIGHEIVMVFEYAQPDKPIVMGIVKSNAEALNDKKERPGMDVYVDGKHIVFNAEKDIVFRCGEASITLTRAGKILIRGAYIINRSTGVNRIKGGSVQIN